jgi:hypothetical protein
VAIFKTENGFDFVDFCFVNSKRFSVSLVGESRCFVYLNESSRSDVVDLKYIKKQIFAGYFSLKNFLLVSNMDGADAKNEEKAERDPANDRLMEMWNDECWKNNSCHNTTYYNNKEQKWLSYCISSL